MRIKVLGASGSEVAGQHCPAFAVDGQLLLDAGTIGVSLTIDEEQEIRYILLTHAHLDHIKGIPFLLDNLVSRKALRSVTVLGAPEAIDDLRTNILNDRIWPDFTRIPTPDAPVVRYATLRPDSPERIGGYTVAAETVSHTVCAYGYILEDREGKVLAYTGDTGPTDRFWTAMNRYRVDCLITEASFPSRMEEAALRSGHLTPSLLRGEMRKMRYPPARIFLMHAKPQHQPEIEAELDELGRRDIRFLRHGEIVTI